MNIKKIAVSSLVTLGIMVGSVSMAFATGSASAFITKAQNFHDRIAVIEGHIGNVSDTLASNGATAPEMSTIADAKAAADAKKGVAAAAVSSFESLFAQFPNYASDAGQKAQLKTSAIAARDAIKSYVDAVKAYRTAVVTVAHAHGLGQAQ